MISGKTTDCFNLTRVTLMAIILSILVMKCTISMGQTQEFERRLDYLNEVLKKTNPSCDNSIYNKRISTFEHLKCILANEKKGEYQYLLDSLVAIECAHNLDSHSLNLLHYCVDRYLESNLSTAASILFSEFELAIKDQPRNDTILYDYYYGKSMYYRVRRVPDSAIHYLGLSESVCKPIFGENSPQYFKLLNRRFLIYTLLATMSKQRDWGVG